MVLRASIDASTTKSGLFAVGGVAFGSMNAVTASRKWKRLMNGRTFHMTDLNARQGDFKGIDDDEKHKIMVGIVDIIKQYATYFVAVSCDLKLISEAFPSEAAADPISIEMRNAFRTPYGIMCHLAMTRFGLFERERPPEARRRSIAYTLETGDDGQKGFVRYIQFSQSVEARPLIEMYSLNSLIPVPKGEMEDIFHAADFIAWEWAKHVERQRSDAAMRKSLSALTESDRAPPDYFGFTLGEATGRQFFRHYDDRHIGRLTKYIRQTVEAETNDDLDLAMSEWAATR